MFQKNLLSLTFLLQMLIFVIASVVASVYEDGKWYLGKVLSKDDINMELNIHFYEPAGEK